jgi:hypothetical protein
MLCAAHTAFLTDECAGHDYNFQLSSSPLQDNRNRYFLITALQDAKIPLKELGIRMGLKKNELRMAPAEALQETLQVLPGSANPLSACHDTASRVILLLDQGLKDGPFFIHPMTNTKTVKVTAEQLQQYLESRGKHCHWVDVSVTELQAGPDMQDLKAIVATVEEVKVRGEAKRTEKGTDSKKEKKAAKYASSAHVPLMLASVVEQCFWCKRMLRG